MRTAFVASTLMGLAAAVPQGSGATPNGCSANFDGKFEITVAKVTYQKRDIQPRAECGANGVLVMSLKDGTTTDALSRTGYIASNGQFQFDGPPQAGALLTSGFSVCENNLLALGGNKTFYRCLSGTFYNLYNINWAPQCEPVSIIAIPCGAKAGASQIGDGQVVGTTVVATTIVTALPDGQPQVITTQVPVPITSYYPTSAPVSQISDGQIQVPPPQTPTSVATGKPAPSVSAPASSAPAPSAPVTTKAPVPSATGSVSLPTASASGPKVSSSAAASTTAAPSSSAAGTTAASSPSTSAPAQGGSSRMTASFGALFVAFAAFSLL